MPQHASSARANHSTSTYRCAPNHSFTPLHSSCSQSHLHIAFQITKNFKVRNSSAADASAARYCTVGGAVLHKCSARLSSLWSCKQKSRTPVSKTKAAQFVTDVLYAACLQTQQHVSTTTKVTPTFQ
jgi:hypothetical protein